MNDPRTFPDAAAAPAECARLHRAAEASIAADTGLVAAARDREIAGALDAWLTPGSGQRLSALLASAPSAAVHRHLWRILAERERAGAPDPTQLLRLFALPVVVVAGIERASRDAVALPDVVADVGPLEALLRDHRALAGHQTFALGNALAAADELEPARLPELLHWRTLADAPRARAVAPAAMTVTGGSEGVFLRFLVGTVLAAPGADPLRDNTVGGWGIPFARSLGQALSVPGVSLLALPRAPQPLSIALWQGRLAQREVGAQLFASNAIRKLRAATGEPSAVISVHRVDSPAGGGEVRLSLSSPFDPREAEGFRYPLLPLDRVEDVVQMLTTLLADCRIAGVRMLPGVHADRDQTTGLTLLFKAADLPPDTAVH